MVSEGPSNSLTNAVFALRGCVITSVSSEVPHASSGRGRENLNGDDESNNPEQTEEEVNEHVIGLAVSLDSSDKVELVKLWSSHSINIDGGCSPPGNNRKAANVCNDWQEHDPLVLRDELTGSLHD